MNSLSWMIYAADVLGNIQGVLLITAIVVGIAIAAFVLFTALEAGIGDVAPGTWLKGARWVWVPIVLALISAVIPSSNTVYLMAASEAGEAVVTSPDAKEMLNDLKSIIRKKLKQELSVDEKPSNT